MVLIKMVSFLEHFLEFSSNFFFILEQFSRVAEAYEVLRNLETRAVFDQFGEEGLKNGLPKKMGGWSEGYTFHGDAKRVFRDFFGTDNPFADFQVNLLGQNKGKRVSFGFFSEQILSFQKLENALLPKRSNLPNIISYKWGQTER